VTANGKVLRRTYEGVADRARGLAYYLKKHGYKKVGILATNTPAFLESMFGIVAASGVSVGMHTHTSDHDLYFNSFQL
jgi:acyl-CoA synthetase (AMP-forming)/AMP-acid ligase II